MTVYDKALDAFWNNPETASKLILHNSYGEPEEMPLWYFFRAYDEMPQLETIALSKCNGKVLDVGAGTGVHSELLQMADMEVTAIETSRVAVDIMNEKSIKAEFVDFFKLKEVDFNTILCLMNGLGFIGKLNKLKDFLRKCDQIMAPGGQVILDTSDISYLYEGEKMPENKYYGEVRFQYEYEGQKGEWFDWIYVDQNTLKDYCKTEGWTCEVLFEDENDQYLVRLTKN